MNNKPNFLDKLNFSSPVFGIVLIAIILILINFIASTVYQRIDLTSEKRYSLSYSTENLLKRNKKKIYVKVYLEGDLQSGFLRLRNATEDLLKEMSSEGDHLLTYDFINPTKNATTEEEKYKVYEAMAEKGLSPTNLKLKSDDSYREQIIFPSLEVVIDGKSAPVQILENQIGYSPEEAINHSIISLEYKVASAIKKLTQNNEYIVTIMQGHGEYTPEQMGDFIQTLQTNRYKIAIADVTKKRLSEQGDSIGTWIPEQTDVLVIARPTKPFSEVEKYRIDQFVMNGGKVLWAIDQMDADMKYIYNDNNLFMAQAFQLNLDDLLFKYGVRINHNLIQDGQLSAPIPIIDNNTKEPMLFSWLYYPLLTPSQENPIGKNLDPVLSRFASSIDTIIVDAVKSTVILSTSQYGKAIPEPVRVHLSAIKEKPDFKYFKQPYLPAGVLLEGTFSSLYKNRLQNDFIQTLKSAGLEPKVTSKKTKMIVISDADILKSDISSEGQIYPMGYDMFSRQTFANKDFVLNCMEYLADDDNLIESRNKEIKVRLLDGKKTKEEALKWQLINVLVPFILIVIFVIIYRYVRNRRWTTQEE